MNDREMIRRLNWMTVAVVAVLALFIVAGIYATTTIQPKDVDLRLQKVEESLGQLRASLEVRPAEVLKEVQLLKAELEILHKALKNPEGATNDN